MPCTRRTDSKYSTRPSPPFPANECKGKTKRGNDGGTYESVPDARGVHRKGRRLESELIRFVVKGKDTELEKCRRTFAGYGGEAAPYAALLRWRDVQRLREGKLASIQVVEPQGYEKVTVLTAKSWCVENDCFFTGDKEKKFAVTGTGSDEWWVVNPSLVRFLKRSIRGMEECLKAYTVQRSTPLQYRAIRRPELPMLLDTEKELQDSEKDPTSMCEAEISRVRVRDKEWCRMCDEEGLTADLKLEQSGWKRISTTGRNSIIYTRGDDVVKKVRGGMQNNAHGDILSARVRIQSSYRELKKILGNQIAIITSVDVCRDNTNWALLVFMKNAGEVNPRMDETQVTPRMIESAAQSLAKTRVISLDLTQQTGTINTGNLAFSVVGDALSVRLLDPDDTDMFKRVKRKSPLNGQLLTALWTNTIKVCLNQLPNDAVKSEIAKTLGKLEY